VKQIAGYFQIKEEIKMSDAEKNSAALDVSEHGLKKHDMKISTVVFMIFCLCAAGAYGIEEMIPESGPGLTLLILILLPFIWAGPFGLIASELGSVRPQEGGYYKWVQEALGEFWGFQAGWWRTISIYIDNSLYVILAGSYLAAELNLNFWTEYAVKIVIILIFTYINVRGIKDVGIVSTILSVLVIIAFAMVGVCGLLNWHQNPFVPFTADGEIMGVTGIDFVDWVYYIGAGIAIGIWMYCGYESMSTVAGEVTNPQVIPKATLITIPLIACVYILPTMAGLASISRWDEWGTDIGTVGYSDVITTYWSPAFGLIFVVVAVLANCSIYNTYIASGSRGFFALADDYLAPPVLVKCDKKYGVPYVAVWSIAIVNIILCPMEFTVVIVVDVFLLVASYIMIFISAMILRKRIPQEEYKFRIPSGYGLLCLLCIVPIIIAFIVFFINGTEFFIGGMVGITTGPILYVIWKRRYGGLNKKNPAAFPVNPKTGLAVGDIRRMSVIFFALAAMGGIATAWLPWFEGDWGPDYYLETYGSGLFSNFSGMIFTIKMAALLFALIGVLCAIASIRVEPRKEEAKI
jgi:amino acid transporter